MALLHLLATYRYFMLAPLAILEGPVLAFVCGAAVAFGYFNPLIVFGVLMGGDIIPDFIYFYLGHFGRNKNLVDRYGKRFGVSEERFKALEHFWQEHGLGTTLLSKLAYGITPPLMVSAGFSGMSFRYFFLYYVCVDTVLIILLMLGGYHLAGTLASAESTLKDALLALGAAITAIIIVVISLGARKALKQPRRRKSKKSQESVRPE